MKTYSELLAINPELEGLCKDIANSNLTYAEVRTAVGDYGFDALVLNTIKLLMAHSISPAMQQTIQSGAISPKGLIQEFERRLRVFQKVHATWLSPSTKMVLKRLDTKVTNAYTTMHPDWTNTKNESVLYCLMRGVSELEAQRLHASPLQRVNGTSVNVYGAFSLLALFTEPKMTADDRWRTLVNSFEALSSTIYELEHPSKLREAMSYDRSPIKTTAAGWIDVKTMFEMDLQSRTLAEHIRQMNINESKPYGLLVRTNEDTVIFERDPGGEYKHTKASQKTEAKDLQDPGVFQITPPGTKCSEKEQLYSWAEPWTWPDIRNCDVNVKAQMMTWSLMDYKNPETAMKMADALGLPWDIMNDKSSEELILQDPYELEEYFENLLSPLEKLENGLDSLNF